ncbi:MAG: GNAT family N-acetyltransferase [Acidobacteria bacterium]|nr:GNAT family N-acetyltransferase [Acidobacteriota bacterium]
MTSARHRKDAQSLQLAIVERGTEVLAVMAFSIGAAFAKGRVRALSTTGPFMDQIGDLRNPLISPDNPVETWQCLLTGVRRFRLPGLLRLDNLPGDGPLSATLREAIAQLQIPILEQAHDERAFARRPQKASEPSPLFTLDHSSSGTRKHRARLLLALQRELGSELRIVDRSADPEAVEQFLDLEASGWKGQAEKGGHALRLVGHDQWFAEVAAAFRADGKLVVLALTDELNNIVYMTVGFKAGDGVFGCLDAYDERFSAYSAGTFGRIAEWKHIVGGLGADFFDPNLSSYYVDSTRLYPDRRPHETLLLAHGGMLARTIIRLVPAVRRARTGLGAARRRLRR